MNKALILGASGGIGRALVQACEARGTHVTAVSRQVDGLDLTDEACTDRILGALDGPFDALIVATGALEIAGAAPEKALRQISAQAMADQFALNAIGPALVLKHAARLMPRTSPSVCAVLTARVGSIGDNRLGGWTSYRAAKAAANQVVRTASIELARTHKHLACIALHPGTVATAFTEKYLARHPSVPPQTAAAHILSVLETVTAKQTGTFLDWAGKEVPW